MRTELNFVSSMTSLFALGSFLESIEQDIVIQLANNFSGNYFAGSIFMCNFSHLYFTNESPSEWISF